MSDIVDIANDLAEHQRAQAIANARQSVSVQPSEICEHDGIRYCFDCDAVIPQARIDAIPHASLCVECTEIRENQ